MRANAGGPGKFLFTPYLSARRSNLKVSFLFQYVTGELFFRNLSKNIVNLSIFIDIFTNSKIGEIPTLRGQRFHHPDPSVSIHMAPNNLLTHRVHLDETTRGILIRNPVRPYDRATGNSIPPQGRPHETATLSQEKFSRIPRQARQRQMRGTARSIPIEKEGNTESGAKAAESRVKPFRDDEQKSHFPLEVSKVTFFTHWSGLPS